MGPHMATRQPIQETFFENIGDVIAEEGPDEISGGQRDAECADANHEKLSGRGERARATGVSKDPRGDGRIREWLPAILAGSLGSPAGRSR